MHPAPLLCTRCTATCVLMIDYNMTPAELLNRHEDAAVPTAGWFGGVFGIQTRTNSLLPWAQAHSVVFASSGTLLLCCVERTAALPALRRKCRATFPGAARKQSSIMHVTLGRVLTAEPLPEAVAARISNKAAEWSARVRGMQWNPPELTHIQEESFSTVAGPRTAFPWKMS